MSLKNFGSFEAWGVWQVTQFIAAGSMLKCAFPKDASFTLWHSEQSACTGLASRFPCPVKWGPWHRRQSRAGGGVRLLLLHLLLEILVAGEAEVRPLRQQKFVQFRLVGAVALRALPRR